MLSQHRPSRAGWTDWHPVGVALMVLVGTAATRPAWRHIFHTIIEREQTQTLLLLPPAIVWLLWVRRQRFKLCRSGGTWIGPLVVAGGWLVSMVGSELNLEVIWHLGALSVVLGCIVSVLGVDVLRRFAPAFAATLFVVPIPFRVEWEMMRPVADLATALMQAVVGFGQVSPRAAAAAVLCAALLAYTFAFSLPYRDWVRAVVIGISPLAAVLGLMVQEAMYHELTVGRRLQEGATWEVLARWVLVPLTLGLMFAVVRVLRWAALPLQHYKLAEEA